LQPRTATGSLNANPISGLHDKLLNTLQLLPPTITPQQVAPGKAIGSWPHHTALGQQRNSGIFQKLYFPHKAVAAMPLAFSTGTAPDSKLADPHRKSLLKNLHIGNGGIAHVNVAPAPAMPSRAGTGTTTNRLVKAKALVSKEKIIHRPLSVCL
jgi:hypothetical protein